MRLLISVAVHENIFVVEDIIRNLKYYLSDPVIILHARHDIYHDVEKLVKDFDDVILNPQSLLTGFMDGSLFFVHFSNLKYVLDNTIDFQYFLPFGSNQLFIKSGLEKYIANFQCSAPQIRIKSDLYQCAQYTKFYYDSNFDFLDKNTVAKAAPEGHFYHVDLIKKMIDTPEYLEVFNNFIHIYETEKGLIKRKWISKLVQAFYRAKLLFLFPKKYLIFTYALEEIIFPNLCRDVELMGKNYCFINWEKNLAVTQSDITELLTKDDFFAVKRVSRDIKDPVRVFIKEISNGYKK